MWTDTLIFEVSEKALADYGEPYYSIQAQNSGEQLLLTIKDLSGTILAKYLAYTNGSIERV